MHPLRRHTGKEIALYQQATSDPRVGQRIDIQNPATAQSSSDPSCLL